MEPPKYRAFISYSHRDSKWADWLHKAIESYRPPRKLVGLATDRGAVPRRLAPVFKDREELASATDLGTVITEALQQSACQIVICSPHAARSRWVNEEILAFKRLGREDRIYCLIVAGEPNTADDPARADEECFPPAVRFRLDAAGNLGDTRTEPIAADARPGKDGRNNAKLKLIAGLLGLGFDALRRREQQRRNRQLFAVACAATAGMVVTSGLAAYALVQRAAAQRQSARAEAEAETAKQTTNFMVDLFRISDPSEARGNSVTAREMLDKGAARIDSELAGQPAIQATLLDTVGTVYMGLGLYGKARPLLDRAVSTRERLPGADPMAKSVSLTHLADLLTLQANYATAEKAYRESIAAQSAQPPTGVQQAALARSLHGLGTVLANQGRYADAEASLRAALMLQQRAFGGVNGELGRTLQDLADVVNQEGEIKAAIPLMQDAVGMQRRLHRTEPHPDLAEALNDLGLLRESDGDYDAAEHLFRESIAMKRRLLGEKHPEIAAGLNNLALVLNDKSELPQAEATYRQALAMERELLGAVHPTVADTLNNIAFVQYDRGDARGALQTERAALGIYRQLFPGDHPEIARITNRVGYWLTQAHQYAAAGRDLEEALAMRRRLLGDKHPDVASSLTHVAILQIATRKYADALESASNAARIYSGNVGADHWKTAIAESAEGAALSGLGSYTSAQRLLVHANAILARDLGAPQTYRSLAQQYLRDLHRRVEDASEPR